MRRDASRGFTLIEVMFAVSLFGIIAATALFPLVFTVESLEHAQKQWGQRVKVRTTADDIFTDVRSLVENTSFMPLRTVRESGISSNNSSLIVWTYSPVRENKPVGMVVYRIISAEETDVEKRGLYRWFVTNSKAAPALSYPGNQSYGNPMKIDPAILKKEDGKLILRGAEDICFFVWDGKRWAEEYEGSRPEALKVEISINGKKYSYEEMLPAVSE
jgi:prepilin-type N-terminal cleavage/methylation domain-containing protein